MEPAWILAEPLLAIMGVGDGVDWTLRTISTWTYVLWRGTMRLRRSNGDSFRIKGGISRADRWRQSTGPARARGYSSRAFHASEVHEASISSLLRFTPTTCRPWPPHEAQTGAPWRGSLDCYRVVNDFPFAVCTCHWYRLSRIAFAEAVLGVEYEPSRSF